MSFESLTSLEARQALNELKTTDPTFYAKITSGHVPISSPSGPDGSYAEDNEHSVLDLAIDEDSATKVASLEAEMLRSTAAKDLLPRESDGKYSNSDVDVQVEGDSSLAVHKSLLSEDGIEEESVALAGHGETSVRVGKRQRKPSSRYRSALWVWTDNSDSEDD